MVTGPYGRQWISPRASAAFSAPLIEADDYCIQGDLHQALRLYRTEACRNYIARRRLSMIQRQLRKTLRRLGNSATSSELGLGFVDWYPGFEKDAQGILDLFSGAGLNVRLCAVEDADILVAGSYGNKLMRDAELSQDKLVILFTGENICPSYDIHDFSISTRRRTYCGKNVRYPQWLGDLRLKDGKIFFRHSSDYKIESRQSRDLAISAIYNNSTPEREEMLSHLRHAFGSENIHIYGSQRTGEINKLQILSRTVINLCFENSLGEGYVTEKLLHARMMGCKALYWGDISYLEDFKNIDILNIRDADSVQAVIEWCRIHLKQHAAPPAQLEVLDQSLFSVPPSYDDIHRKISEWTRLVLAWRILDLA